MTKLTPEKVTELANEHSVKVFIMDQQQVIHNLKRQRDAALAECEAMRLAAQDALKWFESRTEHETSGWMLHIKTELRKALRKKK